MQDPLLLPQPPPEIRFQAGRAGAGQPGHERDFGGTNAKLFKFTPPQRAALENDRFAQIKEIYEKHGEGRSNLRYGYVAKPVA